MKIIGTAYPDTSQMTGKKAFEILQISLSSLYDSREAKSISRIVLQDIFNIKTPELAQENLQEQQLSRFWEAEARLKAGEPVQYVTGQADFYGLKLKVNSAVLIPRQETEELVEWILETIPKPSLDLLDIGTGSGCIALALKSKNPFLTITGIDISPAAIEVARYNGLSTGIDVEFTLLDILRVENWNMQGNYDVIVSNPPYIPYHEDHLVPAYVKKHEPELALFVDDKNPLLFYRSIADFALQHLNDKGFLFFECNEFNADEVGYLLDNKGFKSVSIKKDIASKNRMIRAQLLK